jgi:predicted AAA+ superfamily ATPase
MFGDSFSFLFVNGVLKQIPGMIKKEKLLSIDLQFESAEKNVQSFIKDGICLNMLLWGEKGCGKSSMIKQLLYKYADHGLRIVQILGSDILDLYELYGRLSQENYNFILLFDDISFNYDDEKYRGFKSMLEGGVFEQPSNVMIVATSNRRHLIFEQTMDTNDLYNRDNVNELTSLFSRFGLAIGFYPMNKQDYLEIVKHYLYEYQLGEFENWEIEAENFATDRGGRNGRVAKQFAVYKKIYG